MAFFKRLFGSTKPVPRELPKAAPRSPAAKVGPSPEALALFEAAVSGDVATVTKLLSTGLSVDTTARDVETPLHGAARNGRFEIVQLLLGSGANIEAKSARHGETPLLVALDPMHYQDSYYKVVKYLLRRGANASAANNLGDTALDYVAIRCTSGSGLDKKLLGLVLAHGGDRYATIRRYEKESAKWKRETMELFKAVPMAGDFVPGKDEENRRQQLIAFLKASAKVPSQDITEIKLSKSYRAKVGIDNGLEARCSHCNGMMRHELATPDSVRCVGCKRLIKLVWV